jgi:DNA-binding NarL/FixJ family response regulator
MSLVLNTGVYPPLLETRRLVLEHAGHIVITRAQDGEIVKACRNYEFDVVVIGQSAPAPVKRRIFRLVRRHCQSAKVLELTSPDLGKALEDADSWLEIHPMQTDALLERIASLAGEAR